MTEQPNGGVDIDRRLIEDYLPIQVLSAEAAREKSVRKGHISTLHLWWARRPLVAARAAVYGALVQASRFVPPNGSEVKAKSLGRANAAKFIERLCKYPGTPQAITEAEEHILAAHAERLTTDSGKPLTVEDIRQGRAPRPKVLDMFAGGGAIPLEALRLGCDAYALDLNPVAHIIELCTLVYPQKYGNPDSNTKGSGKDGTWAGLAAEVRHWGEWVLTQAHAEVGDLYPLIPDPRYRGKRPSLQSDLWARSKEQVPPGFLVPIAYLWTRTVPCKNPSCGATVPLVKQTWLCKKENHYVALKLLAPKNGKRVRFKVVDVTSENGLDFDPDAGSKGGNAACPFCGTVADNEYVKAEGRAGRMGDQFVAVVAGTAGSRGWVYLSADDLPAEAVDETRIRERLDRLLDSTGVSAPHEGIAGLAPDRYDNSLGITVRPYGLTRFADLFSPRQLAFHICTAHALRKLLGVLEERGYSEEYRVPILALLACVVDRATDFGCKLCVWNPYKDSGTTHAFGRQTITMVWDYSEVNPFNTGNASWLLGLDRITRSLGDAVVPRPAAVFRGSATALPFPDSHFDAIVCDPPYYDIEMRISNRHSGSALPLGLAAPTRRPVRGGRDRAR
jgi:putative DNA methylase